MWVTSGGGGEYLLPEPGRGFGKQGLAVINQVGGWVTGKEGSAHNMLAWGLVSEARSRWRCGLGH
jgi:hypothetical protein